MATLRQKFEALLDQYDLVIREAFLTAIEDVRSNITLRLLVERLEKGDIEGALRTLNLERAAFGKLDAALAQAYNAGGGAMAGAMPTLAGPDGLGVVFRFDVRNLRAEEWLRSNSSRLITEIIDDQRQSIRAALEVGMSQGRNPRSTALDIIGRLNRATGAREGGVIGLTARQSSTVEKVRSGLLSGDPEALRQYLTLARRDKRFDRTVLSAIKDGKPLTADMVTRIVGRYADGQLQLRGETIARTESLRSLHAAKHEAFRQGLEKTNYPPSAVTKIWRSAADDRVRHSHRSMNGQEVQGLDAAFVAPSGARLAHPGDTSLGAGPEEVINCRCDTDYRIDFAQGLGAAPIAKVDTKAIDAELKNFVLANGRQRGVEFLAGYDRSTGQKFGTTSGHRSNVSMPPDLLAAAREPRSNVVVHHNHPRSSSFSEQDILTLNVNRGLKGVWAHGHDGSSYYAEPGKLRSEQDLRRALKQAHDLALTGARKHLRLDMGALKGVESNFNHVVMQVAQKLGVISNYQADMAVARGWGADAEAVLARILAGVRK